MSSSAAQNEQPKETARPRILVAEDDPDVRRMLQHVLKQLGDVVSANNGQEALELAKAGPRPDLIVTDVMMPRMDGITFSRSLKKIPGLSHVPILMLTAKGGPRDMITGINAGARFYITKPFKTDDLVAKAKKALTLKK